MFSGGSIGGAAKMSREDTVRWLGEKYVVLWRWEVLGYLVSKSWAGH
jgi:hypothetical protein